MLLGRKAMTKLDSVVKSREITFPTKIHIVKALDFPVVMYRCENWAVKQAEHQRTGALNCGSGKDSRRVPWTARISNQSIPKKINPYYSLEGLMLKLQHFDDLMQRTSSLKETLMLGKIESRRRRGVQRIRWLNSIID